MSTTRFSFAEKLPSVVKYSVYRKRKKLFYNSPWLPPFIPPLLSPDKAIKSLHYHLQSTARFWLHKRPEWGPLGIDVVKIHYVLNSYGMIKDEKIDEIGECVCCGGVFVKLKYVWYKKLPLYKFRPIGWIGLDEFDGVCFNVG